MSSIPSAWVQELKAPCGRMVTLDDLQTMDGMGVIKGSSWKVPPLEDNPCRFAWCASRLATQTKGIAHPGTWQQQHHTFCRQLYSMQCWCP